MKINFPKLPPRAGLEPIDLSQLVAEVSLEHVLVSGIDASNLRAKSLALDESLLEKVTLAEARLERLGLSDAELKACDFSAARCPENSIIRVRITDSRMTGVDLSRGTLKDVVFENCKLDMANFRFAKLTRVQFIDCILNEADFQRAELKDVAFLSSHLEKVEFSQARIKDVDARTSELVDIRGWQSLRGLTIDPVQLITIAPQLAQELGLAIEE
jgi:uncharacterized protein YjbI with pentapeptide repeats